MWPNPQFPADLVLFTEEILNEKLHFLCSIATALLKLNEQNFEKGIIVTKILEVFERKF